MSERITEAELRQMEASIVVNIPLLLREVRRLRKLILVADAYLRDNEGDDVILEEAKLIRDEDRP